MVVFQFKSLSILQFTLTWCILSSQILNRGCRLLEKKKSLFHPQFSPHLGQLKDLARDVYLVYIMYVQWSLLLFADLKSHCLLAVIVSPCSIYKLYTVSPITFVILWSVFSCIYWIPIQGKCWLPNFKIRIFSKQEGFCGKFLKFKILGTKCGGWYVYIHDMT